MSVSTRVDELSAIYEITKILANAGGIALVEGVERIPGVRERLRLS